MHVIVKIARAAVYGQTHCKHCVAEAVALGRACHILHFRPAAGYVKLAKSNNYKMVPILTNLCCLEANSVSICPGNL